MIFEVAQCREWNYINNLTKSGIYFIAIMFSEIFLHVDAWQFLALAVSAVLIGINKTALPGIGVLPVVILTMMFPTRLSTGLQLLMLAMTDLVAVAWYRRHADWKIVLRLLPWAYAGLGVGSLTLRYLSDDALRPMIGGIVLFLVVLNFIRSRLPQEKIPSGMVVAAFCGILLGFTTQVANAAGPVAAIYFLAMRLPKEKYMGCSAWFFLIINWTKLPIFIAEGRITLESLWIDLCMIPFLLLGAAAGILLLPRMPQKLFEAVIQILIVVTAVKLCIPNEWFTVLY